MLTACYAAAIASYQAYAPDSNPFAGVQCDHRCLLKLCGASIFTCHARPWQLATLPPRVGCMMLLPPAVSLSTWARS